MTKPDKSSYNLKMRTATRREPRVEETVVYHWGRILGTVVSLLLVAFVVYWFFSASPGTSTREPTQATAPVEDKPELGNEEPEVGSSVSGTIQRSPTEPASESDTAMAESSDARQSAEESSPFATTAPQPADPEPDTSPGGQSSTDQAGIDQPVTDQAGADQGDVNQADSGEASSAASTPPEPDAPAATPQAETDSVAGTRSQPAQETTSTPPASVIDDPADRPAPTDDPESTVATADANPDSGEAGMAQLDIASSHLQRIQLTWELRNREPTTALPAVINLGSREVVRVYFFNELQGLKGQTVYHDWYLNGERVARVDIDAFLDRMRASSGKYINREMLGDWRVEAVTDSGTVLGSGSFSVTQ